MAITNATHLADFGTGIGTDGSVLKVDQANSRVGLGTTNPTTTVTVGPIGAAELVFLFMLMQELQELLRQLVSIRQMELF